MDKRIKKMKTTRVKLADGFTRITSEVEMKNAKPETNKPVVKIDDFHGGTNHDNRED